MDIQYVAYYRVSTQRQGKSGLGLESQRAIVGHYCPELVAEFTELESAKDLEHRPILAEAVQLCLDNGYGLVVAKVDRLSRNTADTLKLYERLEGRLISCDLPAMDDDPSMFKFMLTIQAALAERERELISIRTRAAMDIARQRGTTFGTPANLTPETRGLGSQANKQQAIDAYFKDAYTIKMMRDNGLSYDKIANRLNSKGFTTRTGKPLSAMTVYRIHNRQV